MLADHERLLASPFLQLPLDIEGGGQRSLAGYRIGAYTLERPIGVGGMGAVWLARRSDGRFEGAAAVKLLNLVEVLSTEQTGSVIATVTNWFDELRVPAPAKK